jgi:hypothetical protein
MMRFEWNALRVGDHVRVHHRDGGLHEGSVAFVNALQGSNGVGVRMQQASGVAVWWPLFLDVHLAVGGAPEPCARCDELVASP